MAKKTLSTGRTMMRAVWVPVMLGTTRFSEPSFSVLATSRVGNVLPPSVDRRISTRLALMPAAVVPATFQVTVCVDPVFHETAVLGLVTSNAAPVSTTVTFMSSQLTAPPLLRLSRTVTRKFSARLVVGSRSPGDVVLSNRSASRGKVRVGLVVGGVASQDGTGAVVGRGEGLRRPPGRVLPSSR